MVYLSHMFSVERTRGSVCSNFRTITIHVILRGLGGGGLKQYFDIFAVFLNCFIDRYSNLQADHEGH